MTEFMTSQLPGTKRYVPIQNAIHITCLACISQSINQAKQISIALYVASKSDAALHRDHPPAAYHMLRHATTACCQFDHPLIIGCGNSKIGYEIIRVSHP